MNILKDPEANEVSALKAMVDFASLRVLEIGCGDGRLTWRYAASAAHVTAIDPDAEAIEAARAKAEGGLKERVRFLVSSLEAFADSFHGPAFDLAIFSWSL